MRVRVPVAGAVYARSDPPLTPVSWVVGCLPAALSCPLFQGNVLGSLDTAETGRPATALAAAVTKAAAIAGRSNHQNSNCTLNRVARGARTAVGCSHRAPTVATSKTVSYAVVEFGLNTL